MAEGKESSGWNVQGGPFRASVLYLNLFLNHVRSPCVPQLRRGLWILMRPDLGCRALPGFQLKLHLYHATARCLPLLTKLTKLQVLDVEGTGIPPAGLARLRNVIPGLRNQ